MYNARATFAAFGASTVLLVGTAAGGGAHALGASALTGSARPAHTILVHPGESIQRAVNSADPGDTVLIEPGLYHQSVLVAKNYLRIRGSGAGPGGTVLEPAAVPRGVCAKALTGICVYDPHHARTIVGVRVDSLLVRNFEGDGVTGVGTRGLVVANVRAENNARYGVTRFASSGGAFINNVATGSADAGIYIGDSPRANLFIAGNDVRNNGFGILARNAQHVSVEYNDASNNCIGIFIWWLPGVAGDGDIRFNTSRHNNKFCPRGEEIPFNYSGSGIALVGAQNVVVGNNAVLNNRGFTPVSGGIVLSAERFGGPPSAGNTIQNNTAFGDAPADIVNRSSGQNTFRFNHCDTSRPSGLC